MSLTGAARREREPEWAAAPGDGALVARASAGDERAFRALYDRHRPSVYRVARGFGSLDRDEVEDVVQDAFVRAFSRLASLREGDRFGPWMLAITRSYALSRLASRRAAAEKVEQLAREPDRIAEQHPALTGGDRAGDVELVRRALAELPDGPVKETVHLFYGDGDLTAREIAERLGVGKSTITMRLERFRAQLKRRLAAEIGSPAEESST